MSSVPRIAVVGAGHWGKNLVRNFAGLGALAAVCDPRPELRERLAAEYPDVSICAAADEVFAMTSIDGVAIATPPVTHGPLTAQALAADKHVFVEKPLCLDLAEGAALAAAAAERGLVLMVGHLLLYHPAFIGLKETVAKGAIGELRYVYSNRLSLGQIRREENALWSFAPHDISMILALIGTLPERVICTGGVYLSPTVADTTLSHLSFARGVQAHVFVSWLHPYKDHRIVVVGSGGMIAFHDSVAGPEKLLLYRHVIGWNGDIPNVDRATAEPIPYDASEPLALECQHFLDCIATGAKPRSDASEALRVLSVLEACERSLELGGPVRCDPAFKRNVA